MRLASTALAAAVLAACTAFVVVAPSQAAARDPLLAPERACPNPALSAPVQVQMRAMLCYHGWARRRLGLPFLRLVLPLRRSAVLKARWIDECNRFTHVPCGHPFVSAFSDVGYTRGNWFVGENLAWGAGPSGRVRAMFLAWLRSPEHRANIIRPEWRSIGLARLHGARLFGATNVTLWVAHFGSL
jgi:uncharacterized protein YkwD